MTPSPTQKPNPGQNPKVHDFKSRFGVVPDSPPPKLTRLQARRAKRKRVRTGMIAFSLMLGIAGGTAFLIAQDFDQVASFFKPQPATKQVQTAEATPPPPPSAPLVKTTTEESPVLLPQATAPAPAVAPPPKPAPAATVVAETPAAVPPPAPEPAVAPAPSAVAASGVTAEAEPDTSAISLDPPPAEAPPPAPVVAEASPEPQIQPEPVPAPAAVPEPNETIAAAAPPLPQAPPQPVAAAAPPQPKFVPKITTESFQYPSPPVVTPDGVLTAGAAQTQTKVVTVTTPAQPEAIADTAAPAPAPAPAPQAAAPVQEQQVAMAAPASETAAPVVKPSSGAQLVQGQVFRDCENCPDLVVVLPPQGLPPEQIGRAKIPAGAEPLKPYAIGRFEVTFDDWARCMAGGGCSAQPDDAGWGRNTRPVINVSHDDAVQQYIAWLSSVTGATYRLPTGTEWDFAEEGGGVIPASGVPLIDSQTICQSGNYVSAQASSPQEASCADGFPTTAPAGSFKPNALGLHDMRGNVWEWVSDCWTPGFTFRVKDSERDCRKRLLRGGSWSSRAALSATPPRGFEVATRASKSIGFRVARTLP